MDCQRRAVVVGGGIVGLSVARELSAHGVRVILVERQHFGAAATGASFAWLNNQAIFRTDATLTALQERSYFTLHRLALGAWRRAESQLGDLGIRWSGMVAWCRPGNEEAHFEKELVRRQAWGSPTRRVSASDLEALIPGCIPGPIGVGFYGEDEGSVNPRIAVSALLTDCLRMGAEVRYPCEVTEISSSANGVALVTSTDGVIECDDVVVACGTDTPALVADLGIYVPLVESLGGIVHLEPMPLLLQRVMQSPTIHALQRSDGRFAIAHHYAGSPVVEGSEIDADALLASAVEVLPFLSSAHVERVSVGHRVLPHDGLPIVGRSQLHPNIRCIATNAGFSLGPLLAQLLSTEILNGVEVDLLSPYRADRFLNNLGRQNNEPSPPVPGRESA